MFKFTDDLLNKGRRTVKLMVGLLTGHCCLNKHMSNFGLRESDMCRFCQTEEETLQHILCEWEGLGRLRLQKFIKKTELDP